MKSNSTGIETHNLPRRVSQLAGPMGAVSTSEKTLVSGTRGPMRIGDPD